MDVIDRLEMLGGYSWIFMDEGVAILDVQSRIIVLEQGSGGTDWPHFRRGR
jgi:hypothetical protein